MELSPANIPIIDLSHKSQTIAQHISTACEASGCFYIKNHDITDELIKNVFQDMETFFKQPVEYKSIFSDPKFDRGYKAFESRNINAVMGKFGLPNDPVERFGIGASENIWPDCPVSLKKNVETYFYQTTKLAEKLMKFFSIAARAPSEDFIYENCSQAKHLLKANFYPKSPGPGSCKSTRLGVHTDFTPFTILATDECRKSLQILNTAQEWVYADPIPGAFFVNVGDAMQFWTNDKWKATVHKVVWPEENEWKNRISLAYFVYMNSDAIVESLPSCVENGEVAKYSPIVFDEYCNSKMAQLSGKY